MTGEKLKTLEDVINTSKVLIEDKEIFVNSNKLKQEAIKWVKEDVRHFGLKSAMQFNKKFMEFHNITGEELK